MKLKVLVAAAATLASGSVFAGASGNAGMFSEYLFRGIEQSGGPAVQGGLDYATDAGIYLGTWASNTGGPAAAGGTEIDLYGGYATKVGAAALDFGAVYYLYSEDEEDLGLEYDFWEIYGKLTVGYFGAQVYYTTDYLGDANKDVADSIGVGTDAYYVNLLGNFPLSDTLTFGVQFGLTGGEGAEAAWSATTDEGYSDYSVSLAKSLEGGYTATFGLYGTTFEAGDGFGTVPGGDDGIKAVVGLKKVFDL